jgi:SAM-dependent methyltransferase
VVEVGHHRPNGTAAPGGSPDGAWHPGGVDGFDSTTYGERFADVYDDWYGGISDTEGTVEAVTRLAGGDAVLELGVGTGRIALPLAAAGLEVHGVDASPAMLARLRAKPGGEAVAVTIGDFADARVPRPDGFAVVLVAFNTLFNLPTAAAQRRCFVTAAAHLRPGGAFVVEAFVPDEAGDDHRVTPSVIETDRVVLQAVRRDAAAQTVVGSVITLTHGGEVELRPWQIRYAGPDELDGMAAGAGLTLEARHEGWRGQPFSDRSARHVTVYRRPAVA